MPVWVSWALFGKQAENLLYMMIVSFFKSIYFDKKSLIYERENKDEVLYNRKVRLYDEQYDYSVQMSPCQFNKFLTVMEKR